MKNWCSVGVLSRVYGGGPPSLASTLQNTAHRVFVDCFRLQSCCQRIHHQNVIPTQKTIIAVLLYCIMLYMEITKTLQIPLFLSPLWNHTTLIKGPTSARLRIFAYPVLSRLPKSVNWLLFPWNNLKYCILFQKQIEPGIPKELEMKAISRKTKSCWL